MDPLWIAAIVKMVLVVGYILIIVPMIVWWERKLIAFFQARVGPHRVGPFGLLQTIADGIKLVGKESLIPREVDRLLYMAGPVVVLIPAIAVAAVVPFAPEVTLFGVNTRGLIADLPIAALFVLALTSLGVYGIVLSGWASTNKYSLLGALRSSAQMVSYELPMGLSIVTGLMIAAWASAAGFQDLSLWKVVEAQDGGIHRWGAANIGFGIVPGLLAMITFFICGIAETNRAPFDLPEAESELIGGYHTEYGGLKWAMFFLGEYAAMLNVAAVTTTVFLGGWHAPYPDDIFFRTAGIQMMAPGTVGYFLHGLAWFGLKVFFIISFYIWLRATLPRIRYDRLMGFTWKYLLPFTLANMMVVATIVTIGYRQEPPEVLVQSLKGEVPGTQPPAPFPAPGAGPPSLAPPPPSAVPPSVPAGNAPSGLPGTTAPAGNAPGAGAAPASAPAADPHAGHDHGPGEAHGGSPSAAGSAPPAPPASGNRP